MGPFRQGKPLVLPTPELDAYEGELRARSHRKVMYTGVACIALVMPLLVLLGMAIVPELVDHAKHPLRGLSSSAKGRVSAQIAAACARASEGERAMRAGITAAASSRMEAHPAFGRCPHSRSVEPGSLAPTASYRDTSDSELCAPCLALASEARSLEAALGERSRDERFEERTLRRAEALGRPLGTAVVLQVIARGEPDGVPHMGFTPGFVRGKAYLWDIGRREVLCVGDVAAESSENVDVDYKTRNPLDRPGRAELKRALDLDLARRTEAAVHASLRFRATPAGI